MNIIVERNWLYGTHTLGKIYINNVLFGFTLEDTVRNQKIYGKTAIPYGKYDVDITYSSKFGKDMPLIKDVPNFTGIRIHTGNDADDTSGCLLVGKAFNKDRKTILQSKEAFNEIFTKIKEAKSKGEKITIEIKKKFYLIQKHRNSNNHFNNILLFK